MAPATSFNAQSHEYSIDGRSVPSVTGVLSGRRMYSGSAFWTDESRDRGTAVHAAIHYLQEDALDWSSLDPRVEPYVRGYQSFRRDAQFSPLHSEKQLYSRKWQFAGTLDCIGWIGIDLVLIDFKTGAFHETYALQLAAYMLLVEENLEELGFQSLDELPKAAAVCELKPYGFKLHTPKTSMAHARALFLCALKLTRFSMENK